MSTEDEVKKAVPAKKPVAKSTAAAKIAKAPAAKAAAKTPAAGKADEVEKPAKAKKAVKVAEPSAAHGAKPTVTHEQIAELAKWYWGERGHGDGMDEEDWLRAEKELLSRS